MRALPAAPPLRAVGGSRIPVSRGPLALLTTAVLLVAAGVTLLVLASGIRDAAAANRALTDAAETRQVTAAVSAAVAGIYSYNYADLGATTTAAHHELAGQAAAQYAELSGMLSAAVRERLIVVTTVTAAGVRSLTADSATLLIFLRQNATRGGKPAGSVAAQLQVTAHRTRGQWLITGLAAG
jgi:Mce-associated membrane protein